MLMYEAFVGMKSVGEPSARYEVALANLMTAVKDVVASGGTSWQFLETSCWIEKGGKYHKDFYEARDDACDLGVLVNGEVVNP